MSLRNELHSMPSRGIAIRHDILVKFGEAQAIALALRKEHQEAFLLLDELAARAVAQELRLQRRVDPTSLRNSTLRKQSIMNSKQAHEPEAPVMDANDVWEDAKRLAQARRQVNNAASAVIRMAVPLSAFLAALDEFKVMRLRNQDFQRRTCCLNVVLKNPGFYRP